MMYEYLQIRMKTCPILGARKKLGGDSAYQGEFMKSINTKGEDAMNSNFEYSKYSSTFPSFLSSLYEFS